MTTESVKSTVETIFLRPGEAPSYSAGTSQLNPAHNTADYYNQLELAIFKWDASSTELYPTWHEIRITAHESGEGKAELRAMGVITNVAEEMGADKVVVRDIAAYPFQDTVVAHVSFLKEEKQC